MAGRTVLITGASGFVGSRLAERLVFGEGDLVRALIRSFSSPGVVWFACFPIELVLGDITNIAFLSSAAHGCDVIVHLAYGTKGNPIERREITVFGTENVLQTVLEKGVSKVIHLSTAVHGLKPGRALVDESALVRQRMILIDPARFRQRKLFRNTKTSMAFHYGTPPSPIYGPFGVDWTVRIVREIKAGAILVNSGRGVANLIYVDNLIDAIVLAMEKGSGDGEPLLPLMMNI
jgi:nucleoside-diphosphate-sugar epimerase